MSSPQVGASTQELVSRDVSSKDGVAEALKSKRRSLDQEIDDFKVRKDEEFRRYEEELRREATAGPTQQGSGGTASNGMQTTVERASRTRSKHSKPESNPASAFESISSCRRDDLSNFNSYQPATPPLTSASTKAPNHLDGERELELRSLFTPSYLSFFESRSTNNPGSTSISHNTFADRPTPFIALSSIHTHRQHLRHSATSPLSSSLTTLPSTIYNSTSAPQSSSAPRPQLAESRASSSPLSRNLRSSLRSPERPPREPKHVLFSIDNMVMSPSSSPLVKRDSAGATELRKKKGNKGGDSGSGRGSASMDVEEIQGAGAEGVVEGSRRRRKKKTSSAVEELSSTTEQPSAVAESSAAGAVAGAAAGGPVSAPTPAPNVPESKPEPTPEPETVHSPLRSVPFAQPTPTPTSRTASFSRSYRDLIEPTVVPATADLEADEFDSAAGADPLFDFDDDAAVSGTAAAAAEEEEEQEEVEEEQVMSEGKGKGKAWDGVSEDEDDDDDDESSSGTGSLPIEIRLPGRRHG